MKRIYIAAFHQSRFGKLMGMTVPEIAQAIDAPEREVMFWVMGMRKYGRLAELPDVSGEGYYRFQAIGART